MVQSGDVILVRTKSLIGTLIRFFQNLFGEQCPYNHVAIIAKDKGVYYVYESVQSGVIRTKFINWDRKNKEFITVRPTFDFNRDKVDEICLKLIGTKYDYVSTLIVQLVQQISDERINIGTNNAQKAKKRLYCSEFAAYCFHVSTKFEMYVNWSLTDPQDLFEDYKINKLYEKL